MVHSSVSTGGGGGGSRGFLPGASGHILFVSVGDLPAVSCCHHIGHQLRAICVQLVQSQLTLIHLLSTLPLSLRSLLLPLLHNITITHHTTSHHSSYMYIRHTHHSIYMYITCYVMLYMYMYVILHQITSY